MNKDSLEKLVVRQAKLINQMKEILKVTDKNKLQPSDINNVIECYNMEAERNKKEILRLQEQLASFRRNYDDAEKERVSKTQILNELRRSFHDLRIKYEETKEAKEGIENRNNLLRSTIRRRNAQVSKLEDKYSKLQNEFTKKVECLQVTTEMLNRHVGANDILRGEHKKKDQELSEAVEELDKLHNRYNAAKLDVEYWRRMYGDVLMDKVQSNVRCTTCNDQGFYSTDTKQNVKCGCHRHIELQLSGVGDVEGLSWVKYTGPIAQLPAGSVYRLVYRKRNNNKRVGQPRILMHVGVKADESLK